MVKTLAQNHAVGSEPSFGGGNKARPATPHPYPPKKLQEKLLNIPQCLLCPPPLALEPLYAKHVAPWKTAFPRWPCSGRGAM